MIAGIISRISGPVVLSERMRGSKIYDVVKVGAEELNGEIIRLDGDQAVVQVYEGTRGIDTTDTTVRFTGEPARINVSLDMLGRVFSGVGKARDGGPEIIPEAMLDIAGTPINPSARDKPADFIQTGMSAIDGLNTLRTDQGREQGRRCGSS